MSALFPVRVEVAESASVNDVLRGDSTITWTDICDYVDYSAAITCNSGRAAEATSTTAGSASFTVKTLPNGTKAPLELRRPVRISVQVDSVWRPVWTGSVSSITAGWEGGVRGTQQVSCADNVAVAERTTLGGWPVEVARSVGDLLFLYPLDDANGEQPPRDSSGQASPPMLRQRPVGTPAEGTTIGWGQPSSPGSPLGANDATSPNFPGTATGGWCLNAANNVAMLPSNLNSTLSVYVYMDETPSRSMSAVSASWDHYARGYRVDVGVNPEGVPFVAWTQAGAAQFIVAAEPLARQRWHHLAVTFDETATAFFEVLLYADGVEVGSYSGSNAPFNIARHRLQVGASLNGASAWRGNISHVAMFSKVLTPSEVESLAEVTTGYVGESSGERFTRLIDLVGWGYIGSSPLPADSTRGSMGYQSIKGKSLAAALGECATVENMPWGSLPTGVLSLPPRVLRYNRTGSTLSIPANAVSSATRVEVTDAELANVVTASNLGGATVTLIDETSVEEYGRYLLSVQYAAGSDAEAETYAAALLEDRKEPKWEADTLVVDVTTVAASIPDINDVVESAPLLGAIVEVTGLPADSPLGVSPRFFVEGVADRFSPSGWSRTFNVSPVPANTTAWRLGVSLLGVDTRLGL